MKRLILIVFLSLKFNVVELSQFDQSGVLVLELTDTRPNPITPTGAKLFSWELE